MQENLAICPVKGYGYGNLLAAVRFTPTAVAGAQVMSENWGVKSVSRTGTGTYRVQLADKHPGFVWHVETITSDTTSFHTVRVEAYSVANGTLDVVHRAVANASVASGITAASDTLISEIIVLVYARGQ